MKIIYLLVLYICAKFYVKAFIKEFTVKDDIRQLSGFIKQAFDNDVIIYFENEYYDVSLLDEYDFEITMDVNVKFIGRTEGTILDYHNDKKGKIKAQFSQGKSKKFTMENIIFENYESDKYVYILNFISRTFDFYIELKNCTFRNCVSSFLSVDKYDSNNPIQHDHLLIENCKF